MDLNLLTKNSIIVSHENTVVIDGLETTVTIEIMFNDLMIYFYKNMINKRDNTMRDYSNIPVIKLEDSISLKKAEAQVHHAEPVIIQLPEHFNIVIDPKLCCCDKTDNPTHYLNCKIDIVLKILALENDLSELKNLADIAHEAGQVIDIETDTRRIIIHD